MPSATAAEPRVCAQRLPNSGIAPGSSARASPVIGTPGRGSGVPVVGVQVAQCVPCAGSQGVAHAARTMHLPTAAVRDCRLRRIQRRLLRARRPSRRRLAHGAACRRSGRGTNSLGATRCATRHTSRDAQPDYAPLVPPCSQSRGPLQSAQNPRLQRRLRGLLRWQPWPPRSPLSHTAREHAGTVRQMRVVLALTRRMHPCRLVGEQSASVARLGLRRAA